MSSILAVDRDAVTALSCSCNSGAAKSVLKPPVTSSATLQGHGWWTRKRPLWLRHSLGTYSTLWYTIAGRPMPSESWQHLRHGGGVPPRISDTPCRITRQHCCFAWSVPQTPLPDILSTPACICPWSPSSSGRLPNPRYPETFLVRQTQVHRSNRFGYCTYRNGSDVPSTACPPTPPPCRISCTPTHTQTLEIFLPQILHPYLPRLSPCPYPVPAHPTLPTPPNPLVLPPCTACPYYPICPNPTNLVSRAL